MPTISYEGMLIELPSRGYYNHLIGLAYSACAIAPFACSSLLLDENAESPLLQFRSYLRTVVPLIEDLQVRDLFDTMDQYLGKLQAIDEKLVESVIVRLGRSKPKSAKEYRKLVKAINNLVASDGLLAIYDRMGMSLSLQAALDIVSQISETKIVIVKRILAIHPELLDSEYIDTRDRVKIGKHKDQ